MALDMCAWQPDSSPLAFAIVAKCRSFCAMVMRAPVEDIVMRSACAIIWSQVMPEALPVEAGVVDIGPDMVFCAAAGPARQSAIAPAASEKRSMIISLIVSPDRVTRGGQ